MERSFKGFASFHFLVYKHIDSEDLKNGESDKITIYSNEQYPKNIESKSLTCKHNKKENIVYLYELKKLKGYFYQILKD